MVSTEFETRGSRSPGGPRADPKRIFSLPSPVLSRAALYYGQIRVGGLPTSHPSPAPSPPTGSESAEKSDPEPMLGRAAQFWSAARPTVARALSDVQLLSGERMRGAGLMETLPSLMSVLDLEVDDGDVIKVVESGPGGSRNEVWVAGPERRGDCHAGAGAGDHRSSNA